MSRSFRHSLFGEGGGGECWPGWVETNLYFLDLEGSELYKAGSFGHVFDYESPSSNGNLPVKGDGKMGPKKVPQIVWLCPSTLDQGGKSWQPFGECKNGHTNFGQACVS